MTQEMRKIMESVQWGLVESEKEAEPFGEYSSNTFEDYLDLIKDLVDLVDNHLRTGAMITDSTLMDFVDEGLFDALDRDNPPGIGRYKMHPSIIYARTLHTWEQASPEEEKSLVKNSPELAMKYLKFLVGARDDFETALRLDPNVWESLKDRIAFTPELAPLYAKMVPGRPRPAPRR